MSTWQTRGLKEQDGSAPALGHGSRPDLQPVAAAREQLLDCEVLTQDSMNYFMTGGGK